jgi:hypothetical protein
MSALETAAGIILGRVRGRSLARRIASAKAPITPVAVYFADAPSTLYQLRRWYAVLEALNAVYPTTIITSEPATYDIVRRETSIPVTFATGPTELARVLSRQQIRVVLYSNHNALNFRVLRFADPVHVFIGHGESAKDSSVSRQLKAYDFTWVADAASIAQLRTIRGFDADRSAVVIGSPWLGFLGAPPAIWKPDTRSVVLYAPTWEGDRPTMRYSSIESSGEAIVDAVLGAPELRLVYRPHPWLGRVRRESAAADARIRRAIVAAADSGSVVDTGEYGWSLSAADLCVTDISSVAFDARALGTPVLVTVPSSASVPAVPEAAFAGMVQLESQDANEIRQLILDTLAGRSSAAPASVASMDAMIAAIGAALQISHNTL